MDGYTAAYPIGQESKCQGMTGGRVDCKVHSRATDDGISAKKVGGVTR
jgi:hypothetical protein